MWSKFLLYAGNLRKGLLNLRYRMGYMQMSWSSRGLVDKGAGLVVKFRVRSRKGQWWS